MTGNNHNATNITMNTQKNTYQVMYSDGVTVIDYIVKHQQITTDMTRIEKDQRPIGKSYSKHICFYDSDIISQTEKALLIVIKSDLNSLTSSVWIPKSKTLVCTFVDERDIIDNGRDYVANPNYGKDINQYFVPVYFAKDKSDIKTTAQVSLEHKDNGNFYKKPW